MSTPEELDKALACLPHGPEFRFVDRMTALTAQYGDGEYRLRGDEPFLAGHFPGSPLMPGVLLIEAAAQVAGIVAQCDPDHPPLPGLKLAAIRAAKISGSAIPGETISIHATLRGRLGRLVQASCTVRLKGPDPRELLSAEIVLSGDAET